MATFRAVTGALDALRERLLLSLADDLAGLVENPDVRVLGSQDLRTDPSGHALGIYLHRLAVDPYGRNRYLPPGRPDQRPRPELPVNLHLLLVGWSTNATAEALLVGWAMQQLGASLELDVSHLAVADSGWGESETLQVIPEDMSTEDLMRVWDSLPGDYRLSAPYLVKTLRLEPARTEQMGPPVRSIVMPVEQP